MGKLFKTSALGGFRKKDVIKYLEELGAEKAALQTRVDRLLETPPQHIEQGTDNALTEHCAQLEEQLEQIRLELAHNSEAWGKLEADLRQQLATEWDKNRQFELQKQRGPMCDKHCPELTVAIKCPNDSASGDARRAEEALHEFRRSMEELTREFSGLVAAAEDSGGEKTSVKLKSIKEILDRVRRISEN